MNARILKIKEKIKSNRFDLKRKFSTFSIFLIIASTFWLLNTLSNEYNTVIKYPVEFTGTPEGKVLVGELPDKLYLRVRGKGFTLLQYKIFPVIKPIKFKLNTFSFKKLSNKNDYEFYVLTNTIEHKIESKIKSDISLISIQPDTLYFQFTKVITKKVAVKPNLKISFDKQYMLSGNIVTIPDSIYITGPKSILDTTGFVYTKANSLRGLNESIRRNVGLEKIDNVQFSTKRVNIKIKVEKYTESKIKIPIEIINMPDSMELVIMPQNITVNYKVVLSKYEDINKTQFKAVVNYNDVNFTLTNKLKVYLKRYPKDIFSIDYSPKNIEFILKK